MKEDNQETKNSSPSSEGKRGRTVDTKDKKSTLFLTIPPGTKELVNEYLHRRDAKFTSYATLINFLLLTFLEEENCKKNQ